MKKIDGNELKKIELETLIMFKKLCEENQLRYFLSGGTLLGAVRHSGFIPWDDDIDIWMPRNDYKRLVELYLTKNIDGNYKLLSHYTDKNYYKPFARIVDIRTTILLEDGRRIMDNGVGIEIFPMDGVPKSKMKAIILFKVIQFLKACHTGIAIKDTVAESSVREAIRNILNKFLSIKVIQNIREHICQIYRYETADYIAYLSTHHKLEKELFKKEVFDIGKQLEFEKHLFNVPYNYDVCLKALYGEYMKLPDESERRPQHEIIAYWK